MKYKHLIIPFCLACVAAGTNQPTSIPATLRIDTYTNWIDYSVETPVCNAKDCAIQHTVIHHQLGTILTNKIVVLEFEGKTVEVFMGQTEKVGLPLKRDSAANIDLHRTLNAGVNIVNPPNWNGALILN